MIEWESKDYQPRGVKLRPCPFCGASARMVGVPEFVWHHLGWDFLDPDHVIDYKGNSNQQPTFAVACSNRDCGAAMHWRYTEEEMAFAWNARDPFRNNE
jgi:hypothetical protein